uniref:SJCHGC09760 protein n=1 Tax=Schistosoma japonicum TaxID=6182 RepID=Q5BQY5_SCHJA|nr:SJCHGC09760 protein [Schistosoma japonicum]
MNPILLNAVNAAIKYRKDSSNKEFHDEYHKSRQKLNGALYDLANMIEKAQYQRFELFKILPSKERINRLVLAMDKERETCQILD